MSNDTPGALAAALGHGYSDPQWRVTSDPPIPPTRFGKDHWSTLAYVETRIVDHGGLLDHEHMRCDADRHPIMQVAQRRAFTSGVSTKYPTRLKSGEKTSDGVWGIEELPDHDDYDCLDDLVAAGLLEIHMPCRAADGRDVYVTHHGRAITSIAGSREVPSPSFTTGLGELTLMAYAVFALADLGKTVAGELRAWKGAGGNFHQFEPHHLEQA